MIARELTDFFATFGDAPARLQRAGEPVVPVQRQRRLPACLLGGDPLRRRAVQRGPGVRPRDRRARRAGARPTTRRAAVLHAHDYGAAQFMRRYFDEYRGLRETIDHVEPLAPRSSLRGIRDQVAADRRFMREQGIDERRPLDRALGRPPQRAQGVRRARLARARAAAAPCSARCRSRARDGAPRRRRCSSTGRATRPRHRYDVIAARAAHGPGAAARRRIPGMADRERLHIACDHPDVQRRLGRPLRRSSRSSSGSSGWATRARSGSHDAFGAQPEAPGQRAAARHRRALRAASRRRCSASSTSGTAPTSPSRPAGRPSTRRSSSTGCRARAYMVNDHEPEFFPTSVEHEWAASTYGLGLYGIVASPWLRDLYVDRYGGEAGTFQYGVDQSVYHPRPVRRRRDTVIAYARVVTPRRAVAARVPGARRAQAPAPRRADRAVRQQQPAATRRSSTRTPASPGTSSSPGCSPRPPRVSACR